MWGNKVRLISTHNGVENLFNQYIGRPARGTRNYSVHRITLDDAHADGLYKPDLLCHRPDLDAGGEKKWRDDLYKNAPNTQIRRRRIRLHSQAQRRRTAVARPDRIAHVGRYPGAALGVSAGL